jgi:hypothetical protein
MTVQAERVLQQEVQLRLRAGNWPVIAIPVPNGIWIPARTPAERAMVARIIARMKADGLLLPGAFDLAILWANGGGMIDLKRDRSVDMFGKVRPAGRPTEEQSELAKRAADLGINHAFCSSWEDVSKRLREWGAT